MTRKEMARWLVPRLPVTHAGADPFAPGSGRKGACRAPTRRGPGPASFHRLLPLATAASEAGICPVRFAMSWIVLGHG
jgi:hypothetical protein